MVQRDLLFDEPAAGKVTCLALVRRIMSDGRWRFSHEIQDELLASGVMASESSITARLRDLRKPKYGGLNVVTEKIGPGRVRYRVE